MASPSAPTQPHQTRKGGLPLRPRGQVPQQRQSRAEPTPLRGSSNSAPLRLAYFLSSLTSTQEFPFLGPR